MKTFLENHPHLNYIQRCIRHLRDDGFITEVLDIGKNPLKIEIERPGEKNPGRLLYIAQTMGCDGFFAELRFILHELFFCDTLGLTPVVVMPSASCYCEKEPVNGTTNPFEYYFSLFCSIEFFGNHPIAFRRTNTNFFCQFLCVAAFKKTNVPSDNVKEYSPPQGTINSLYTGRESALRRAFS